MFPTPAGTVLVYRNPLPPILRLQNPFSASRLPDSRERNDSIIHHPTDVPSGIEEKKHSSYTKVVVTKVIVRGGGRLHSWERNSFTGIPDFQNFVKGSSELHHDRQL